MTAGPLVEIGGFPIQFPHPLKFPWRFRLFQKPPLSKEPVYLIQPSSGPLTPHEKIFYGKKGDYRTSPSSKGLLIKIPKYSPFYPPLRAILLNQKEAQVTLYLKKGIKNFSPFLSSILFFIVYYTLIQKGGFFLHASGILDQGKGFLFVGPGGSGKSTIASLFGTEKDSVILNDDRTIVRKMGPSFWLYGTPWSRSRQSISARSTLLTAIFFLSHGKENRLTRLSQKEALKRFLPELYLPPWDPDGHPATLSLALEVCARVPTYSLGFAPDQAVVSFLRDFSRSYDKDHTLKCSL